MYYRGVGGRYLSGGVRRSRGIQNLREGAELGINTDRVPLGGATKNAAFGMLRPMIVGATGDWARSF